MRFGAKILRAKQIRAFARGVAPLRERFKQGPGSFVPRRNGRFDVLRALTGVACEGFVEHPRADFAAPCFWADCDLPDEERGRVGWLDVRGQKTSRLATDLG
ncbi:MAG: hypothetical protein R2748_22525 [Bryobacterales bacterium]